MNRDGRDDEDLDPDRRTHVGLGAVERRGARNGDTPPSPQSYVGENGNGPPTERPDAHNLQGMNPEERWIYIAEQIVEIREYLQHVEKGAEGAQSQAALATAASDKLESKVDTCITDVRALASTTKRTETSVNALTKLRAEERDRLAEQLDRLERLVGKVDADHLLDTSALAGQVSKLAALIGQPPQGIDLSRASQVGKYTAKELADAEAAARQATGLFAIVGALVMHDVRAAHNAGTVAGQTAGAEAGEKAGAEAAHAAAKKTTRRASAVVGSVGTVVGVAASTAHEWLPPLVHAFTKLFGG